MVEIKHNKHEVHPVFNYVVLILFGLSILFLVFAIIVYFENKSVLIPISSSEINVTFSVGNMSGFDVTTSQLTMGRIIPTGTIKRSFYLNSIDKPVFVSMFISDEISDYISVDKNNFMFYPNSTQEIIVTLTGAENLEFGNYTGKLYINYFKREYSFS